MHNDIISLTDFKNDASGWVGRLQSQPPVVLDAERPRPGSRVELRRIQGDAAEVALLTRMANTDDDHKAGRAKSQQQVLSGACARLAKRLAGKPAVHDAA